MTDYGDIWNSGLESAEWTNSNTNIGNSVSNSGSMSYDLPLIKRYLPSSLKRLDTLPELVIKKNSSYMALETKRLRYLDLTNYLAAGTSLSAFYKTYKVKNPKGSFPYEWFDSLEKLKHTELPPLEAFHSTLTNQSISQED